MLVAWVLHFLRWHLYLGNPVVIIITLPDFTNNLVGHVEGVQVIRYACLAGPVSRPLFRYRLGHCVNLGSHRAVEVLLSHALVQGQNSNG